MYNLFFVSGSTVAAKTTQPCLWAGLNNGTIYSYALTVPEASTTSSSDQITAVAAKEIHLRHGAPVIFMAVVDHSKMKVIISEHLLFVLSFNKLEYFN